MHIFYQARKVPTHNVDARGTRRLISEQCDSLESAGSVQLPARPSNPYFLQLAAHCLTIPCWHAILPRVCQTKLPPIHSPRFRRPAPTSLPSLCRISHYFKSCICHSYRLRGCKSCICHSYENNRGVYQLFPFWNSPLHSAFPRPDLVGVTSHLAT